MPLKVFTPDQIRERIARVHSGGAVRTEDAALIFGCSKRTIRRLIRNGMLRVNRITRRTVLLDRDQILALLKSHRPQDLVDLVKLTRYLSR